MSDHGPLRWYTSALRIPTFIGKLPSGEHLYGGPYTATQGMTFAVVLGAGLITRDMWSGLIPANALGSLAQYVVVVVAAIAATIAVRYTPTTSMNPASIALGVCRLVTNGRFAPPSRKPQRLRGTITVHGTHAPAPPPPDAAEHEAVAASPAAQPAPTTPDVGAKLARLLEHNRSNRHA